MLTDSILFIDVCVYIVFPLLIVLILILILYFQIRKDVFLLKNELLNLKKMHDKLLFNLHKNHFYENLLTEKQNDDSVEKDKILEQIKSIFDKKLTNVLFDIQDKISNLEMNLCKSVDNDDGIAQDNESDNSNVSDSNLDVNSKESLNFSIKDSLEKVKKQLKED